MIQLTPYDIEIAFTKCNMVISAYCAEEGINEKTRNRILKALNNCEKELKKRSKKVTGK